MKVRLACRTLVSSAFTCLTGAIAPITSPGGCVSNVIVRGTTCAACACMQIGTWNARVACIDGSVTCQTVRSTCLALLTKTIWEVT